MATLDVVVLAQTGQPVANELVLINTFSALDWAQPGIEINPNPRRTGPDGTVNFYSGPRWRNRSWCRPPRRTARRTRA
jgi:hypothetical protein